jgi:decaprenylphospho-beta-D-erythro-pentofuranosid-2-ulose 2-reductase
MQNALVEYQNIAVLGGRSELGAAVAARLATPFTRRIILAGRGMTEKDAEAFRSLLKADTSTSVEVLCREFDASSPDTHQNFVESLGDVDLAILAFGQLGDNESLRHDPKSAADLVSVNMGGMVSAGLACAGMFEKQGRGHLVFLSSVAGVRARKSNFVYGSTKAGMDAFAQGLGDSLVTSGVKVTIVRPGFVHTAMTRGLDPAPFAATVEQVAEGVLEGLRKGRQVIWVPSILRYVFAILRVLPTFAWRRLPIK